MSKSNGDILIVIVNDKQRMLRFKNYDEKERILIIKELKVVDEVILSIDNDKTVIKSIEKVYNLFSPKFDLFCKWWRSNNKVPETNICKKLNIK